MSVNYDYSIASHTLNGRVSPPKLETEIDNSTIEVDLSFINTDDDLLRIAFVSSLTASEQTVLEDVVGSHDGNSVVVLDTVADVITLSWTNFKAILSVKSIPVHYEESTATEYGLIAVDGPLRFSCVLSKTTPKNSEQLDYENNYQIAANQKVIPTDSQNMPLYKNQIVGNDWHYEPRCFDFFVGEYNSLYNRKSTGAGSVESAEDYGDATMKFYDVNGSELVKGGSETGSEFQDRLDSYCYMTDVIWTPPYDRKCIGANVQVCNAPSWSCYLWTEVDLSMFGLANIPYLAGGLNLRFLKEETVYSINARTANDDPLPAYIPIVFRCRHNLVNDTTRFGIQIFLEHYKE